MHLRKVQPVESVDSYAALYDGRTETVHCKVTGLAANGYLRIVIRKKVKLNPDYLSYFCNQTKYVSPSSVVKL